MTKIRNFRVSPVDFFIFFRYLVSCWPFSSQGRMHENQLKSSWEVIHWSNLIHLTFLQPTTIMNISDYISLRTIICKENNLMKNHETREINEQTFSGARGKNWTSFSSFSCCFQFWLKSENWIFWCLKICLYIFANS